jgi:hypothetical protein
MCASGECDTTPVVDGTVCGNGVGTCQLGICSNVACTEQGIRDAIAAGGGPYTFACGGPTTVVTEAEIVVDNDVILDGEGKLTIDGAATHRVLSISEGVKAELHGWTITNGRSQAVSREELNHGGGIANYGTLLLHDSVITNNEAAPGGICNRVACYNSGGGVFNSGNLTVVSTVVSENGGFYGAGIGNEGTMTLSESTVSDNLGADSGGVSSDGELTVMSSTISGNTGAGVSAAGRLEVTNSTISNNTGTGVRVRVGTASLTYTTISDNSPEDAAIVFYPDAALEMTATLVLGPCEAILNPGVMSNGHNIEGPGDTCGFDQARDLVERSTGELNLGELADNGGPTMTHALGLVPTRSIAIDRIPEADCEVTTDQRGLPRPVAILGPEPKCDVGAFERQTDDQ